ncbi:unnamed protein product [Polarella glacialis]|uniref:histidine kinase n=1 Tax=Polarella glacialis TaxID=89957 RepID=A0A813J6J9_POLGL|nr:unnamed protein product [Polarella glacialis]
MMSVVPQFSQDREVESYVAIGQDMSEICDLKAVEAKKSQLMAVVSHELRSPLHGMIGLTGMMMDSASQSQRRQLQMVKACASRLLDLVTNVMDLTESDKRKRSGIAFHKPQIAVDFAKIAEEAVVMTTLAVDKANKPLVCDSVVLKNEICDLKQIPIVLGDPYKCTQLLYNLLTNSCKFTRHGTVIIRARHLPEQKLLEIDVVDTGILLFFLLLLLLTLLLLLLLLSTTVQPR